MRLKAIKAGVFRIPDAFQRISKAFSLGRTVAITDNAHP
jgi:hypothetical protein